VSINGVEGQARRVGTPLDPAEATQRAARIKALADPVRLQLMQLILAHPAGEVRMGELAASFDLAGPTVSHHLRILCQAGLLERHRRATSSWYRPTHHTLVHFAALIGPAPTPSEPAGIPARHAAICERIAEQLAERFVGVFSAETVQRYVTDSYQLLATRSRISRFLPSLTAAFAADRLAALARVESATPSPVPEVLFVCVANIGRSQIAAGLLAQRAGDRVQVRSAGSLPRDRIDATVLTAMDEIGVYLGAGYPKPLTDEVVAAADVVVTMGCGDACPVLPHKRYLDWPIDDPDRQPLDEVRRIRDEIDTRVRALLADLLPAPTNQ
jgi:arsenate reductase